MNKAFAQCLKRSGLRHLVKEGFQVDINGPPIAFANGLAYRTDGIVTAAVWPEAVTVFAEDRLQ